MVCGFDVTLKGLSKIGSLQLEDKIEVYFSTLSKWLTLKLKLQQL